MFEPFEKPNRKGLMFDFHENKRYILKNNAPSWDDLCSKSHKISNHGTPWIWVPTEPGVCLDETEKVPFSIGFKGCQHGRHSSHPQEAFAFFGLDPSDEHVQPFLLSNDLAGRTRRVKPQLWHTTPKARNNLVMLTWLNQVFEDKNCWCLMWASQKDTKRHL